MNDFQKALIGLGVLVLVAYSVPREKSEKREPTQPRISFSDDSDDSDPLHFREKGKPDQGSSQESTEKKPSAAESVSPVKKAGTSSYEVHRKWIIPNGGWGKTIVIPKSCAKGSRLEDLGKVLDRNARHDRNAFVFVYISHEAAEMFDRIAELSESELLQYDSEFVGSYFKNGNTGLREMRIHPKGINGPFKKVKL